MLEKPSLVTRVVLGMTVGFLVGLAGFLVLPYAAPESSWMLRWGILLWYVTVGAVVGLIGVFERHPVLELPFTWRVRAPAVGAWMNLVLALLLGRQLPTFLSVMFGHQGTFGSPFWAVGEGAVIGFLIGYVSTRFGSEGPEMAGR